MPPGGKKNTGGSGAAAAAAAAASTSTNTAGVVGTSTTATTMVLPQLNLDIYNYFLSVNGGTNATGTTAAVMDTEPILQAIRSAFPDQIFPGSTDAAAGATATTDGTSTSKSNQQNQHQALVQYYTFHPFLLRRIKNLEDEVKELRSSAASASASASTSQAAGGGGDASAVVVTAPVAAATPARALGSRTSAGGRQASSSEGSRSNSSSSSSSSSSSKKRSREVNGIAAASCNTSTAAALQEGAPGQPAAKRPALASASAAPRTSVDIAEMARALAAASTSKKSSKQQPRSTEKSTPSSSANRKTPMPPNEKSWAEMYADLEHYQAGYGHCRVSRSDTDHPYLAKWVQKMRSAYKAYKEAQAAKTAAGDTSPVLPVNEQHVSRFDLTLHRIEKLESIGFDWSLVKVTPWETRYQQLVEFKAQVGHTRVPRAYAANPKLGEWVHQQRCAHNRFDKRSGGLAPDKLAKLNGIGFEFRVAVKKQSWEQRFQALLEYRRANGHVNVFANVNDALIRNYNKADDFAYEAANAQDSSRAPISLVRWAGYQRNEYRKYVTGMKSSLTKEKVKKLQDIGLDLVGSAGSVEALIEKQRTKGPPKKQGPRVSWDERFRQLQAFKAEKGHCRVPQNWAPNKALNVWVNEQRRMYRLKQEKRLNSLDNEKQKRLEDIGFEFRVNTGGRSGARVAPSQQEASAASDSDVQEDHPGIHGQEAQDEYHGVYGDDEAAFM